MRVSNLLYKFEIEGFDFSEIKHVSNLKFNLYPDEKQKFFATLFIKRTITDLDLLNWFNQQKKDSEVKKQAKLSYIDEQKNAIVTLELQNVWPVSWESSDLHNDGMWQQNLGEETIALAVESMKVVNHTA